MSHRVLTLMYTPMMPVGSPAMEARAAKDAMAPPGTPGVPMLKSTTASVTNTTKAAIQIFAAAFMLLMALNLLGGFTWLRELPLRLPEALSARLAISGQARNFRLTSAGKQGIIASEKAGRSPFMRFGFTAEFRFFTFARQK